MSEYQIVTRAVFFSQYINESIFLLLLILEAIGRSSIMTISRTVIHILLYTLIISDILTLPYFEIPYDLKFP